MPTMAANGLPVPALSERDQANTPYLENGRLYHSYRRGVYMFPCDEEEKDRMDIYHKLLLVARREQLHTAPLPSVATPRILDLGCGTGIWAIDMADRYQNAEVLGLDLANIQPEKIPPNLRFRIPKDYEDGYWALGENSWDLIHIQMACGSVSSWPEMYQKIFMHLRPGYGYIEQVEIDLEPRCDDGTMPYSPVSEWYDYLRRATAAAGRSIAYNHTTRQMLQTAGFIDIQEQVIRVPFNSWSADPQEKDIGRWYNLGLTEGLEALSYGPFTRVFRWSTDQIDPLLAGVKKTVCTKKMHGYNNVYVLAQPFHLTLSQGYGVRETSGSDCLLFHCLYDREAVWANARLDIFGPRDGLNNNDSSDDDDDSWETKR